jgi:hypothetical protein
MLRDGKAAQAGRQLTSQTKESPVAGSGCLIL